MDIESPGTAENVYSVKDLIEVGKHRRGDITASAPKIKKALTYNNRMLASPAKSVGSHRDVYKKS